MSGPGDIDAPRPDGDEPALTGDEALAAEYVLGVLDHPARLAVTQRLRNDAALAALVAAWQDRLAPLAEEVTPEPAPDLIGRLETRLFGEAPPPARGAREGFWRGGLWAGWLLGALAALAVGAVILVELPRTTPVLPHMAAELRAEGSDLVIAADWENGMLTLERMAGTAPAAGAAHEVWIIRAGATPVSLGMMTASPQQMPMPELRAGETLAISREPEGGSPTGLPTGPVIAAGMVTEL